MPLIHRRSLKPNLATFFIVCLHGKCLKEAIRPRARNTLWHYCCVRIRWLIGWKDVFTVLQGIICSVYAGRALKNDPVLIFFLLTGLTRVPSTGFSAKRSDSPWAQDTLARSFFQVPEWLVSIYLVFPYEMCFGWSSSSTLVSADGCLCCTSSYSCAIRYKMSCACLLVNWIGACLWVVMRKVHTASGQVNK